MVDARRLAGVARTAAFSKPCIVTAAVRNNDGAAAVDRDVHARIQNGKRTRTSTCVKRLVASIHTCGRRFGQRCLKLVAAVQRFAQQLDGGQQATTSHAGDQCPARA